MAVSSVLGDVDSSLSSALNALAEQLPDSAQANLQDAVAGLAGATAVLSAANTPAPYMPAVDLLHTTVAHYRLAVDEGLKHADAAQADETAGHASLAGAVALLNRRPEATLSGALQAQALALAAAHRAGRAVIVAARPVVPPTAQPLAKRLPAHRHASPVPVAATPTTAPVHAATPVPTATARPPATSTPRPLIPTVVKPAYHAPQHRVTRVTPNLATFLRALTRGGNKTASAYATIQQGVNYLQAAAGPLDPPTTAATISYLDLAGSEVRTAVRVVTTPALGTNHTPSNASLRKALTAFAQVQRHLQSATAAVEVGQPGTAQIELALAGNYLRLAHGELAAAQKAFRAGR